MGQAAPREFFGVGYRGCRPRWRTQGFANRGNDRPMERWRALPPALTWDGCGCFLPDL